ncbi:3'-5' exoribonuclease YhaM family protein [Sedimentisphaera salicampi]|uniref:3'-5' exoribonuclease YhaM n=1 Tax=Sedimentisphaera salicampi TaxID=1941349 RepID=A0A1W6LPU8_9BACT|nr:OB-fold nucleic acid binding domain-containing protein [Sedimentisphaera salicampi]ARN57752.1 3'-5' exoribonuclease YhaM [Sedimentisphaera salicampi]OXU14310.1 3'-5' exoribonuclease YhaM [Sedimentisphaera salicampi]
MPHEFIKELKPGRTLNDIFMVTQPVLRNTSRGDLYIAMFLSDKTGKVNCRMWNASEETYNSLPKEGFIRVNGKTELYKDALQIVVNRVEVIDASEVNVADFLPATEKDIDKMFNEVCEIISRIKEPYLKALMDEYLADEQLMDNFRKAPAAVKMHHAYLGGLLEHTNNMLKSAVGILPYYPQVQGELVVAGIFLHDLAKTEELRYALGFGYTNTGQLVGHIVQSAIWLDQKADVLLEKGVEPDKEIVDSLMHILLSHHGKYEFGSPKLPSTLEALMVSYLDDLDAKLNFANDAIQNEQTPDDWTTWKSFNMSAGTKFYKKKAIGK